MIAVVDYGAGNLESIKNALIRLKVDFIITKNPLDLEKADKIIFPGVGSFGQVIKNLKERKLDVALKNEILKGKPFLGICLGLQVLFEESEESIGVKGLGIFKGTVVKFTKGHVPHIGWNELNVKNNKSLDILNNEFVYFVHSYYVVPEDKSIIAAITTYEEDFCSAIEYKNITAVQFHPEKSAERGIEFLESWIKRKDYKIERQ